MRCILEVNTYLIAFNLYEFVFEYNCKYSSLQNLHLIFMHLLLNINKMDSGLNSEVLRDVPTPNKGYTMRWNIFK